MAIIRVADYYTHHVQRVRTRAYVTFAVTDVALATVGWYAHLTVPTIELSVLIVIALEALIALVIMPYALEPLRIITTAVAHIAPETNDVTPPFVNQLRHEKTGLKQLVQTIYDAAAASAPAEALRKTTVADTLAATVLEAIPAGVIALDERQNILYHNTLAPVSTNPKGETSIQLLFQQDDTLTSWLQHCITDKVSDQRTWSRLADNLPDTQDRHIYDIVAHYQKGAPVEVLLVCVDRTAAYAPAEEDMDFIALAAHELRGPITIIRGYLDVLNEEIGASLHADQQLLMERLSVSAARLSGYVSNILNVAHYDRHHLQLHLREDSLQDVYDIISDDMQLRAKSQNRLLSVAIPHDLPTIAADSNSLSEVMANLIDNAIKYSNEGSHVDVVARVAGDFVECSVQDHGIGIPAALISNLFSKFYRSHRSRTTVPGTGLGLYISKAIIESHGGNVAVRSQEGQGSTFIFSVPIYATVKDKLGNSNADIIETSSGWIKNHAMYRS